MSNPTATTYISSKPRKLPDLLEAWRHRDLAVLLAMRNIKARYVQTVFGGVWLVLQPLLFTGVITVVLGILLSVPSGGMPYAVFALTGTALWTTFQRALNEASVSLASSSSIVLKVYFPRILVPISAIITALLDFLPILAVTIVVVLWYGLFPGWSIITLPAFLALALLMALACGLWITVLDAVFRDLRVLIPSLLQLVFYATPIVYSESVVPEKWRGLYHLNPFIGVLQGFRWSLISGAPPPALVDLAWSGVFAGLVLAGGLLLFARLESFAVDRI